MGSWSYVSEGKGFMGFVELDSQDLMMRSSHGESLTTSDSGGALTAAPNGLTASSSKLSSSSSRDSSLIDLKLGGFADPPKMSNSLSSPAKRIRAGGGMNSQTPYCQVQGCKKDLSSCKDYHKRHKVCEVHSKTAKVIVNGIEQRFCQQCSRFHLLGEFDDGKRSCRKRLAGHNERRRKPHAGMSSGRAGRLFQTFSASRFQGTGFSSSSFVCQDILPGNIVNPHKFETTNEWYRNVKVEEGADFSHQLTMPLTNGQPPGKSLFGSYDSAKHCPPPPRDGGICGISDTSSYLHDMAGADFGPRHVYHNASLGSEVLSPFETSSTIQGLSGLSNSERARSLLSPRSSSTSMAPLINHHYDMAQVSEKLLSQSGINSCEMMLFSNGGQSYSMNHQVVQGSEYMNMKNQINGRDGPTVDLLQLSSQLQRADHERNSMQVKQ